MIVREEDVARHINDTSTAATAVAYCTRSHAPIRKALAAGTALGV